MLNKSDIKLVKSLLDKNIRHENRLFVAEGNKSVSDLIFSNIKVRQIYALGDWIDAHAGSLPTHLPIQEITQKELEQMSALRNTREVIALFEMPKAAFDPSTLSGLVLALDTLQDPGNLGTIIRLADWYGIRHILCSEQTVDCFNHKVVQSTMGSIGRVQLHYGSLKTWFESINLPIIAGSMEGVPARKFNFTQDMILLLGNEGSGINDLLMPYVTQTIAIERLGKAESLNAAIAGAILVDRYFGQFGA